MKIRRAILFLLATIMLFTCSCHHQPIGVDGVTGIQKPEQSKPQRMSYHFGKAFRVGDDIYFMAGVSFAKAPIYATEYGSENLEPYVPCFDAVCNHGDRTKCCLATTSKRGGIDQFSAFVYDKDLALVIFNELDISFSRPYSNVKVNLVFEDFINDPEPTDEAGLLAYLEALSSAPRRKQPLVYGDCLYYVEIKDGTRTQYRVPITGGKPERVFKEDNIIIKTIINDRFYGIRYDADPGTKLNEIDDRDKIHYFRSDMNYENIETLPEILDFFTLQDDNSFYTKSNVILDADQDFIYVLNNMKVWKIPDSDINAEPALMSDMHGKIPTDLPSPAIYKSWYNDGVIYTVLNTGLYGRSTLDENGFANSMQWFESSTLYSFDIRTGECSSLGISNQSYLIDTILYADGKYVYAEGRYVHDDNRAIEGVTIRLTIDTMRYEVILPDRFWDYSIDEAS